MMIKQGNEAHKIKAKRNSEYRLTYEEKIKNKNNKDRKMDMVLNMQIHPYRKLIRQLNISCKYWSNISAKHIVSHPK